MHAYVSQYFKPSLKKNTGGDEPDKPSLNIPKNVTDTAVAKKNLNPSNTKSEPE